MSLDQDHEATTLNPLKCLQDLLSHGFGALELDLRADPRCGIYTTVSYLNPSQDSVVHALVSVLNRENAAVRVQVLDGKLTCLWRTFLSYPLKSTCPEFPRASERKGIAVRKPRKTDDATPSGGTCS